MAPAQDQIEIENALGYTQPIEKTLVAGSTALLNRTALLSELRFQ
jgi:hypothetical protein